MNPHLILIRHAAVQIDPAVSSHQWQLSADGRFACHTLAQKIEPFRPSRIITSHEAKAQQTGQIIAEQLAIPCASAAGLQEHNRTGVPYFGDKAAFETAVANFFTHPDELVLGQETAVAARDRFETAVNHAVAAHPQENIAIVTHGTVLTLFICQYNHTLRMRSQISFDKETHPQRLARSPKPKVENGQALSPIPFWQSLTLPCAFVLTLPDRKLRQRLFMNQ